MKILVEEKMYKPKTQEQSVSSKLKIKTICKL